MGIFYNIEKKKLYYRPCYSRKYNFCCNQVAKTNSFTIYQTGTKLLLPNMASSTFNFCFTNHKKLVK